MRGRDPRKGGPAPVGRIVRIAARECNIAGRGPAPPGTGPRATAVQLDYRSATILRWKVRPPAMSRTK